MVQRPVVVMDASPNFWHGRSGYQPLAIVYHVEAGTEGGTDSWFARPASGVSSHFSISRLGIIRQHVPIADSAWANGVVMRPDPSISWLNPSRVNPNYLTVSIEHEGYPGDLWTPAMFHADVALTAWLCQTLGIPPDRDHLIGHYQIDSVTRANCPGPSFPWSAMIQAVQGVLGVARPQSVQLIEAPIHVFDQGLSPACDSEAWVGALMAQRQVDGLDPVVLSPAMVYSQSLVVTGQVGHEVGLEPQIGGQVLEQFGAAPLADEPTINDLPPPAQALSDASRYRIRSVQQLASDAPTWPLGVNPTNNTLLSAILDALAARHVVVLFINDCGPFNQGDPSGVIPLPTADEIAQASDHGEGHALYLVDYDTSGVGLVQGFNSWGTAWGKNGGFALPFDWIRTPALTTSAYIFEVADPTPVQPEPDVTPAVDPTPAPEPSPAPAPEPTPAPPAESPVELFVTLSGGLWRVQIGAFEQRAGAMMYADAIAKDIEASGHTTRIIVG